jgi:hypothetical protein
MPTLLRSDMKYDIFFIGANGPNGTTPPPAAAGDHGAAGQDANCNWASSCDRDCSIGGTGQQGHAGGNGTPGLNDPPIDGEDAKPATVTIGQLTGGSLWVFSAGGNGGTAGDGGRGGQGGTGGTGGSGASCPAPTSHCGGCNGGTGGTGGNGGNGGRSGNGGNGATININYSSSGGFTVNTSTPAAAGGKLPAAGSPGAGGVGGSPSGNSGTSGDKGSPGSAGNPGIPSTINAFLQ